MLEQERSPSGPWGDQHSEEEASAGTTLRAVAQSMVHTTHIDMRSVTSSARRIPEGFLFVTTMWSARLIEVVWNVRQALDQVLRRHLGVRCNYDLGRRRNARAYEADARALAGIMAQWENNLRQRLWMAVPPQRRQEPRQSYADMERRLRAVQLGQCGPERDIPLFPDMPGAL